MLLATRNPGPCAFSIYEVAEWLVPSIGGYHGKRFYSQKEKKSGLFRRVESGNRGAVSDENLRSLQWHERKKSLQGSPRHPSLFISSTPLEMAAGYKHLSSRESQYTVFEKLALEQFVIVLHDLKWYNPSARSTLQSWGIKSNEELLEKCSTFQRKISKSTQRASKGIIDKENNPLYHRLRHAFLASNIRGLSNELKHAFIGSIVEARFSEQDTANHKQLADLRYPTEWYPATRAMQRTIHLHVGPTNSGKTYHALQRLEAAETGIYAGPLRLLAHEVYSRFNAKGKPCALVTGEERRIPEDLNAVMTSCTVEMVPLNTKVDVAVIDEIQMMGDIERGWAWTQSFLGVQAKEVHLCGELRTVPLIQELCAATGEKLVIHRYERLSPLSTQEKPLRGLERLRKGDAVIVFSRLGIHAMKKDIEQATGKRCAVVYGSLPPETRAQQANLFNDPDNDYDFLVASDAVGMGLNLSIRRVVFETTSKNDGFEFRLLESSAIKQIAGRAGRYKTVRDAVHTSPADKTALPSPIDLVDGQTLGGPILPAPTKQNRGFVTTLEQFDLPIVRKAMETEVPPLKAAGIFPPDSILKRFASYFPPQTPFSYIVLRLHEISALHPRFFLCRLKDQVDIADAIEPYKLTINDRIVFMAAPANLRDMGFRYVLQEMAKCVADQTGGELLDLETLNLELIDRDIHNYPGGASEYLRQAEVLHKALTLYLWLSYRFAGVFKSQALAFHVKGLVEKKIDECLAEAHFDTGKRERMAKARQRLVEMQAEELMHNLKGQKEREENNPSDLDQEVADNNDRREVVAEPLTDSLPSASSVPPPEPRRVVESSLPY